MPDVITLGEVLVDFVATVYGVSLANAPAFKKVPGGAPANVAAALARLSVPAGFMGKVGDDPFGRFLVDTLRALGVDTSGVRWSREARTALAFVSLRADGEREFTFYRHPSADMLYSPDDVDMDYIRAARAFHFGSISLIAEPSRSATLLAAATARDADPNLRPALWPSADAARDGILLGWRLAQVIKVSEEEWAFLGGVPIRYPRAVGRRARLLRAHGGHDRRRRRLRRRDAEGPPGGAAGLGRRAPARGPALCQRGGGAGDDPPRGHPRHAHAPTGAATYAERALRILTQSPTRGTLLATAQVTGDDQDEYPDAGRQGEGAADWKPPSHRAEGKPPVSRRQNAMPQVRPPGLPRYRRNEMGAYARSQPWVEPRDNPSPLGRGDFLFAPSRQQSVVEG